jgi:serpin B
VLLGAGLGGALACGLIVVAAIAAETGDKLSGAETAAGAPNPEGDAGNEGANGDDTKGVVAGNTAFALELYAKLRGQEGNLFVSPQSISTALAMTYAGARGETAREMAHVLHFTLPAERLHPAFAALQAALKPEDPNAGFRLDMANALWGQKGENFQADFLELTQKHYGAGFRQVDFVGATEQARLAINAWVEEQTQKKITNLLHPGDLDPRETALVLTNAVYLKADWAEPFEPRVTHDGPFHVSRAQDATVPMMMRTGRYAAAFGDAVDVLEMPYKGGRFALVILLPKQVDGLAALEQSLTPASLAQRLERLQPERVALSLPRFKTEARCELVETLKALGMGTAFTGDADFSGMNGKRDLCIAKVIHQTFVAVDEAGTEAAAATAVTMARATGAPTAVPKRFEADHPFIYLIRDRQTGAILFLGRLVNPK